MKRKHTHEWFQCLNVITCLNIGCYLLYLALYQIDYRNLEITHTFSFINRVYLYKTIYQVIVNKYYIHLWHFLANVWALPDMCLNGCESMNESEKEEARKHLINQVLSVKCFCFMEHNCSVQRHTHLSYLSISRITNSGMSNNKMCLTLWEWQNYELRIDL